MLHRLFLTLLSVAVILTIIDLGVEAGFRNHRVMQQIVEIQTPATLFAKLVDFRELTGTKVLLLGDSLVYGRAMGEHGDAKWREHTLSTSLEKELEGRLRGPVHVLNLGMNGILPSDLEHLLKLALRTEPDVVSFDLSLRSFSTDFSQSDKIATRPWLSQMQISPGWRLRTRADGALIADVGDLASTYWYLYRVSDFLRWRLFDGQLVDYTRRLKVRIEERLLGVAASGTPSPLERALLLMKAKRRYADIKLAAENPQVLALNNILKELERAGQSAVIFYATENPRDKPELVNAEKHTADLRILRAMIEDRAVNSIKYVPPIGFLDASKFIDHVHLNQTGYTVLARELASVTATLLE